MIWYYVQNNGTSKASSWSNVGPGQPGGDGVPDVLDTAQIGNGPDPSQIDIDAPLIVDEFYFDKVGPVNVNYNLKVRKFHGPVVTDGIVNIAYGKKIIITEEIDAQNLANNITFNGPGKVVLDNNGGTVNLIDCNIDDALEIDYLEVLSGTKIRTTLTNTGRALKFNNWKQEPGTIIDFNFSGSAAFVESANLDWMGTIAEKITVSNATGFRIKATASAPSIHYVDMDHINATAGTQIINFGGANNLNNSNIDFRLYPHKRKFIRDKVRNLLTGNIFYAGAAVGVYQTRVLPFWEIELPAIAFYLLDEEESDKSTAPRYYDRVLQLIIQVIVEEKSGIVTDDIIDDIIRQVENILFLKPTFEDTINDSRLKSTQIRLKENGDRIFASASQLWNVEYDTDAPESQALDDFIAEKTGFDIDENQVPEIQSESTIRI
jgi:hypothetical protein